MRCLAACLFLLAAAPAQAASLEGTWFGIGQTWDKGGMYIDHMEPGGRFHGEYRLCRNGKAIDSTQSGAWSLAGDIMVIAITTVDGHPSPRTDRYRMLAHDAQKQDYVYLPLNFPFHARRVADDYRMPSCELVG